MRDAEFLGPLTLLKGAHARGQGMCAMEAAAYLAGEGHSDHPVCVSPVIAEFLRQWNDVLPDADRQMLKPWVAKVLHTNTGAADEETRAWLATDWLVRVQAPAWLDLAGLTAEAANLRALPTLTSREIAVAVQSVIGAASQRAAAAWAAAWAAAGAAARDAARAAAGDAAKAAAGDAAWAAAWAAARDAAGERLAPTVAQLQERAFDLLDRMIAVGTVAERPVVQSVESSRG
jgi:hypothetical protein